MAKKINKKIYDFLQKTKIVPPLNFFLTPCKQRLDQSHKKCIAKKIPSLLLFPLHANGDTIRIRQEMQCLLYTGFFKNYFIEADFLVQRISIEVILCITF